MVVVACSVPDCTFTTEDVSEALAIALITNHDLSHRVTAPTVPPAPTATSGPKLERPKVNIGVTIEEWNVFTRRWEVFKSGSGINNASAPAQLFQCAGPELGDSLLKANPNAASENLTELLAAMRSLAIIPVATCVLRTELLQLRQERDEPFRTFTAKVRGKAETCSYTASCTCGASVDYTDHVIRDVILNGLYDSDMRRDALGIAGILEKPVNEVIALVETKEMARNALPSPSLSAVSSFVKQKTLSPTHAPTPSQADRAKEATCPGCHITFKIFTEGPLHAEVSAIADTGAQSDLWSLSDFIACGFSRDQLHPISLSLSAANRSPISIEGAFFARLATQSSSGDITACHSMVYVSSSVKDMYLSYDSLLNLGLLPVTFPSLDNPTSTQSERGTPDKQPHAPSFSPEINATRALNDGCPEPTTTHNATCSCPQRGAAPPRPSELPFPCTPENNVKMKAWLLDRYASSTFNTCPHRALPSMEGPPIEIHVDPAATPKACHTPANIPLHWQQRVYDDLLRDEALGVIERVPYGEPVTWCHRMVITRKHDGSPRRTVDISPLNKFCQRETFAMESPFHLARRIPKDTWKTVTDAWNGYHSVPLRVSDRHLTTFITPFGRWRYTRAPQGFLSSGDGYNRRFDAVLAEFERKERCVDDTVHFDTDLEQHWWRTIDFLTPRRPCRDSAQP